VTQARAGAVAAGQTGNPGRVAADNTLSSASRSLFAVAENDSQLRPVESFVLFARPTGVGAVGFFAAAEDERAVLQVTFAGERSALGPPPARAEVPPGAG
jgi:hypothetical protein